ncbi:MAG: NAD(P)-dependent oxidoreductase [Candidatus Bathyarchaeia archaeon]
MLGLIGFGVMGEGIAKNLVKSGYNLIVYDIRSEVKEKVTEIGALFASSLEEVYRKSDVVFLSLPSPREVEEALLKDNVIKEIRKGIFIVNFSTIGAKASIRIADRIRRLGAKFIDAPVSRGPQEEPWKIHLIMVSADSEEDFQAVHDVLKVIGENIIYIGHIGLSQAVKLANNYMCAINFFGVIEAFAWIIKHGLDPNILLKIAPMTPGDSWALRNLVPRMLNGDFKPRFKLMYKDVALFLEEAYDLGLPMPIGSLAHQFLQAAKTEWKNEDWISVVKLYERMTGVKLKKV